MSLFPLPLKPGDTIGIAAPASPFKKELFEKGIKTLESLGFHLSVPDEIFHRENYLGGSDTRRARTLNRLFADPDIKGIVCARGGYGAMRVLRFLDFASIRENPKMVVGFSDVSALLWALYRRCGLVTCHGPTVTTLAAADDATLRALTAVLFQDHPVKMHPRSGRTLQGGTAEGPVVGGNLTTLCHLTGTEDAPDFSGCILLLEDRGEAPYRIDRMLTQMRLAGCLKGVAGVVLGSFEACGRVDEVDRIVGEIFGESHIPVLAGFDVGHGKTNLAVPLGAEAMLDADRQTLSFQRSTPASEG